MIVQPLAPWVKWTRQGIILIGFGWVPCLFVWHRFIEHSESIRAGLIVTLFAWSMIFPWLLLLSVLLPTHKLRILGMPVVFLASYLTATSPPPFGNVMPASAPWLGFWLTTCVAIALLVPQLTTVAAFVVFVAKDMRTRWMRRRTGRAN